jgi:hypothetical protein
VRIIGPSDPEISILNLRHNRNVWIGVMAERPYESFKPIINVAVG